MIGCALREGILLLAGFVEAYWLYVLAVRKRWVFAELGALLVVDMGVRSRECGAGCAWWEGWGEE